MSRVEFGKSIYGEEVVIDEHLSAFDIRVRAFLVVTTLLTGAAVIWNLARQTTGARSALWWVRVATIGAVACGTWHYADNIALPAKHHEPRWLYAALILAPMDKTWGFQFAMHSLMCIGVQQLLKGDSNIARRRSASGGDSFRLGVWLLALSGAAHCVTAGHLLVDPLWSYDWDAALSILLETGFGVALMICSWRQL
jgi:hypothetical protein